MSVAIRHDGVRNVLRSRDQMGIVMNDYTGEAKLFATLGDAQSYADLSCFKNPQFLETK